MKRAASMIALLTLSGCADVYLRRAPSSPHAPWPLPAEAARPGDDAPRAPSLRGDRVYTLSELIDFAESNNPDTSLGWQRARQAALAVGIPLAGYFPLVQATTLVGYQHTLFQSLHLNDALIGVNPFQILPTLSFRVPTLPQPPSGSIGVDTFQVLPFVLVRQELLNIGRISEVRAAENRSVEANALFTAEHEKVIFEVARAYFRVNAARTLVAVTHDALERTRVIADGAEGRFKQGLATIVEVSEARREVAQGEYDLAKARAVEEAASSALLAAIGVDPEGHIVLAASPSGSLPSRLEQKVEVYVQAALKGRADLRAARARLPAAGAGVSRSKSSFAPRIDVFGTVGGAILGARVDGVELPTLSLPAFTAGANLEWLIYDGGLREVQAAIARSRHAEAEQELLKLNHQVVQEVVTSYNEANAALARYHAARALLETAETADGATTKSYLNGLASLTDAMNAQKARALATAAKEQALADVFVATTTLAFASGELISAKAVPH